MSQHKNGHVSFRNKSAKLTTSKNSNCVVTEYFVVSRICVMKDIVGVVIIAR